MSVYDKNEMLDYSLYCVDVFIKRHSWFLKEYEELDKEINYCYSSLFLAADKDTLFLTNQELVFLKEKREVIENNFNYYIASLLSSDIKDKDDNNIFFYLVDYYKENFWFKSKNKYNIFWNYVIEKKLVNVNHINHKNETLLLLSSRKPELFKKILENNGNLFVCFHGQIIYNHVIKNKKIKKIVNQYLKNYKMDV